MTVAPEKPKSTQTSFAVYAPYDRSLIDELPYTSWDHIDAYLAEAERCFLKRSEWLPAWRRIEILTALADLLDDAPEAFATLIASEGGKPISDARVEVSRAVEGIRYAVTAIAEVMTGRETPSGLSKAAQDRRMQTIREPIGPVFAISAFNHPLNLIVHQVVPAIAAGCPVIVKPASATPLTCLKFIELVYKAGLPQDWCRPVFSTHAHTERICADERIAFVSYIGDAEVGWNLRSKLAPGTRCALEHGGNAPVILLPHTDHEAVIPALLKGGMTHAGQVCVSVQRVYLPWAEAGVFARALGEAAEKLTVGNPLHDTTEVGPIIRPQALQRIDNWVQEAVSEGAKVMTGGDMISETLYQPTVLLDPDAQSKVTRAEIFGPVICVYGYDELDDAIARANDSRYAFQAAVFGRDHAQLHYTAERLDAAAVMLNDHTAFRVDWMPFGGRRTSGLGVSGIPYTIQDYTQEKLIVTRV